MTKRATAIVFVISLLTLGGFVIVSNLASTPRSPLPPKDTQPKPSVTVTPQALTSPQPPVSKTRQDEGQLRSDLGQAQTLLDQIAVSISTADWPTAQTHYADFSNKAKQLPAPQLNHPDISPVMQDFFSLYKIQLGRSLNEQNVQQARVALNQLFGIIGEQRARFGLRGVPLEFQRLRFLLREIEIWSEAGDEEILKMRKTALSEAWKDVRPVIAARRSGTESANQLDELIAKLAASQVAELSALLPE
ncbi:MAG: hypothetical protein M3X11_20500, partial [Acidobacteriota bacterium]|nr:hypothetical protein [Acidobacteriota bacterium]